MNQETLIEKLEQLDTKLDDAIQKLQGLDFDISDEFDRDEIIDVVEDARDIIYELREAL
ncbi:MAG: hypothetical protein IJK81_13500 [Selenomonadaceae bacterium]|nr:hypothetical protein [Selenomonadaceae bacterium]